MYKIIQTNHSEENLESPGFSKSQGVDGWLYSLDGWQFKSPFPGSWGLLPHKILCYFEMLLWNVDLERLFYALFWKYMQSNKVVGWPGWHRPGSDCKNAQPARKCKSIILHDLYDFRKMQKWICPEWSVPEFFLVVVTCFIFITFYCSLHTYWSIERLWFRNQGS